MNCPNFATEEKLYSDRYKFIAGVDEVGRGCIAGPVVAAAVILDPYNIPLGINDSKKLSAVKRSALYEVIIKSTKAFAVCSICAAEIDKLNIRRASLLAMKKAVLLLGIEADYIIIDGLDEIPNISKKQEAIIKGDAKSFSIAAASIVAKVTRDNIMQNLARNYPQYGFLSHVGYGTKQHREAIKKYGALAKIHRYSFAPIKTS